MTSLLRLARSVVAAVFFGSVLAIAPHSHATTVEPPSFDELVNQADFVARVTIVEKNSEWRDSANGRAIITKIKVDIAETIAGSPPSTPLVLEMLGGTIGDKTLQVHGTPHLAVGGEYILFIRGNGTQLCPTVAMSYGAYTVKREASATPTVLRANGRPLRHTADVTRPLHEPDTRSAAEAELPALSPEAFAQQIRQARSSR